VIRKFAGIIGIICIVAGAGASSAMATSEYFYKENLLANEQSVSSSPHTIYFVGAYKGYTGEYEIALCSPVNCANSTNPLAYGTGTSLTASFGATSGRGDVENLSKVTGRFTAEIRY
jgi:hypothetical protein